MAGNLDNTEAVITEAVRIVHESWVANRPDNGNNVCHCGHMAQSHYLGYMKKAAGCRLCDATDKQTLKCKGYDWQPTGRAQRVAYPYMPEAAVPTMDSPESAMPNYCGCGHDINMHDESGCGGYAPEFDGRDEPNGKVKRCPCTDFIPDLPG